MQRHTITDIINHSRSTALERSVKYYWGGWGGGGGLKSILHGHNPRLFVLSWYKQYILSVRVKNSSVQHVREHIKRIQRWNKYEDSTATSRNNWKAKAIGGPDQSESISHQPTYLEVFGPEPLLSPTRRRATKEVSKVINRDWVNYHACSLSYYIYVVLNLYISKNDFTKLSTKIIATMY